MRFLKLTASNGNAVYIEPRSVYAVSDRGDGEAVVYFGGGECHAIAGTPEQIFELIHNATGEPVTWYSAKLDADAVDTAIDEAYERGYKQGREDAIADVRTFVENQAVS